MISSSPSALELIGYGKPVEHLIDATAYEIGAIEKQIIIDGGVNHEIPEVQAQAEYQIILRLARSRLGLTTPIRGHFVSVALPGLSRANSAG
jgi:hypothetical protein